MSRRTIVAVALGSNMGDRHAHLDFAAEQLAALLSGARFSSRHDTEPVGTPDTQPRFLNAAAVGGTTLDPESLIQALQAIELARGRERPYVNAPRTLDLDLILFGDVVMDTHHVTLPHPRFRERRFVLEPLAEIGAELVDPVTGLSVAALLRRLGPGM